MLKVKQKQSDVVLLKSKQKQMNIMMLAEHRWQ